MARYEFTFTDNAIPAAPVTNMFALHGVSEEVARGVRAGLRKVATVTGVNVERIDDTRTPITGADPV